MSAEILKGSAILVVDDEAIVCDFFTEALSRREAEVVTASDGIIAVQKLDERQFDLVISDLRMPNMGGMALLKHIIGNHPTTPVVMLTAYATVESAVEAMRTGAFDYLTKPITDLDQLEVVLARALQYRRLLQENQALKGELTERYRFDRMIGPSRRMQKIFEILATVAPTPTTVLVQGESGTGKELVARAIHYNSPRARAPFIKVNCAAMPESLIESELFGHEKGAFTGAIRTTQGKFEAANGGTILLDEIGELPLGVQAKLLRVLQEREFQRVGSSDNVKVDMRLVATTNVDLEKAVQNKTFREDLFFRLNVIPIRLPKLVERRDDIPVLAYHFLRRFAKLHGRKLERFSDTAMKYLANAPWPGNVRELENTVERAVVLSRNETIELADFFLTDELPEVSIAAEAMPTVSLPAGTVSGKPLTIAELEKQHILNTLREQDNHRQKTAELLGISIRTLRNKLNEYRVGLEADR